jgi:hypothetical protein
MLHVGILRDWRAWLTALLIVAALVSFHVRIGRRMPDFQVYRTAAARVLAGEPLYRETDGHWQYKYLPAFAVILSPLALMPAPAEAQTTDPRGRSYDPWADTARVAWFTVSVALLVALLTLSLRLLPEPGASGPGVRGAVAAPGAPLKSGVSTVGGRQAWKVTGPAIVGVTILAMGKFYAHELELGQTNILLAVVVLLALAQWKAGRPSWAGALLAAATVVKPYAIVFLPYLIARRRWRACAGFAVVLLAALLLPVLRYGFRENAALLAGWWSTVTTSTPPNLAVSDNISIAAMYAKWFGVGSPANWLALATAGLLVAVCARVLLIAPAAAFPEYLDSALLLTLIPLLSPQGWDYVLLLATPAVMLLVNHLGSFSRPVRWLAIACLLVAGLTVWDVVGRRVYTLFMVWSVVTFCYLFEIGLLLRLRRTQAA